MIFLLGLTVANVIITVEYLEEEEEGFGICKLGATCHLAPSLTLQIE